MSYYLPVHELLFSHTTKVGVCLGFVCVCVCVGGGLGWEEREDLMSGKLARVSTIIYLQHRRAEHLLEMVSTKLATVDYDV